MCGICGVMSHNLSTQEEDNFIDLMVLSQLRGIQGSGIIAVEQKFKKKPQFVRTHRSIRPSGFMVYTDDAIKQIFSHHNSILIGHARAPTKGAATLENCHPHRFEHITGVHNGTMYEVGGEKIPENQSDSSLVFKHIAEKGIESFVQTSGGAYALVWVDEKERSLNFLRNGSRPLYFAQPDKSLPGTIYWASERAFLELMVLRNHKHTYKNWVFQSLPENTLIRFPLILDKWIRPPHSQACEKKAVQWVGNQREATFREGGTAYGSNKDLDTTGNGAAPVGGRRSTTSVPETGKQSTSTMAKKFSEFHNANLPDVQRTYIQAQRGMQKGCQWCGDPITTGSRVLDLGKLGIGFHNEFVCAGCFATPDFDQFRKKDVRPEIYCN